MTTPDSEVAGGGEVRQAEQSGRLALREDDLLLGAVHGAPAADPAFQGAAHARRQFGVAAQQFLEDGHRAQVGRLLQQGDEGVHHRQLQQLPAHRTGHRRRRHPGLVEQQRTEARHPGLPAQRRREGFRQFGGAAPVMLALVEHQRQHRAQVLLCGVIAAFGLPDAAAVAQQAQRHPAVGPGLMFEQQVEPLRRRGGRTRTGDGAAHFEQQVGDGAAQLLVDEGAGGAAQGGPEDAAPVGVRQAGAEEGGGPPSRRRTPDGTGDRVGAGTRPPARIIGAARPAPCRWRFV